MDATSTTGPTATSTTTSTADTFAGTTTEPTDHPREIAPADGKLGVLTVGLGAVSSTLIAGVELARRGQADPIGSLTQMGTIRLGKRTDARSPRIADFVPLAGLDDIVFGAWDPYPDDAYVAAPAGRCARSRTPPRGHLRRPARRPADAGPHSTATT